MGVVKAAIDQEPESKRVLDSGRKLAGGPVAWSTP
jgi:hypothetical protein